MRKELTLKSPKGLWKLGGSSVTTAMNGGAVTKDTKRTEQAAFHPARGGQACLR
jgi:hypothetical protein